MEIFQVGFAVNVCCEIAALLDGCLTNGVADDIAGLLLPKSLAQRFEDVLQNICFYLSLLQDWQLGHRLRSKCFRDLRRQPVMGVTHK